MPSYSKRPTSGNTLVSSTELYQRRAVIRLATRYGLPLPTAATIAELAHIGQSRWER
jgi:hypothetical protein